MRRFAIFMFIFFAAPAYGGSQILVDTDLSDATQSIDITEAGKSIRGVIPETWIDDSGFQKQVEVRYEKAIADNKGVLRLVNVKGILHLGYNFPQSAFKEESFYRLTLRGRSVSRTPMMVALRVQT